MHIFHTGFTQIFHLKNVHIHSYNLANMCYKQPVLVITVYTSRVPMAGKLLPMPNKQLHSRNRLYQERNE